MRGSDSNECSQRCSPRLRYDLFVINIASTMLGYVYGRGMIKFLSKYLPMLLTSLPASGQTLNKNQDLCVKVAGPVGSLFGQVLFGWLADTLGRKRMCEFLAFFLIHVKLIHSSTLDGLELSMMIVATFAQAVSGSSTAISIIATLTMWRFIVCVFFSYICCFDSISCRWGSPLVAIIR